VSCSRPSLGVWRRLGVLLGSVLASLWFPLLLSGTPGDQIGVPRAVVRSSSWYLSTDGQWVNVVGEVENTSGVPLTAVQVAVTFRDAQARPVARDVGYVLAAPLMPGQRAPFHLLDRVRPGVVTYTLQVTVRPGEVLPLPPLPVSAQAFPLADGTLFFVGEVTNPLSRPVRRVRAAVTFYDEAGRVVNVAQAPALREVLPPGERSPLVAHLTEGPRHVSRWAVHVRYEEAPPEAVLRDVVVGPVQPLRNHRGHWTLRGWVRNDGPKRLTFVRLVGALYDAQGRMVNASFSYPLTYHLDPGETDEFAVEFWADTGEWSSFQVWVGSATP